MITTEQEAETKWCPWWQQIATTLAQAQPGKAPPDPTTIRLNCIGADCMCWRWWDAVDDGHGNPRNNVRRGYCGVAGVPSQP